MSLEIWKSQRDPALAISGGRLFQNLVGIFIWNVPKLNFLFFPTFCVTIIVSLLNHVIFGGTETACTHTYADVLFTNKLGYNSITKTGDPRVYGISNSTVFYNILKHCNINISINTFKLTKNSSKEERQRNKNVCCQWRTCVRHLLFVGL